MTTRRKTQTTFSWNHRNVVQNDSHLSKDDPPPKAYWQWPHETYDDHDPKEWKTSQTFGLIQRRLSFKSPTLVSRVLLTTNGCYSQSEIYSRPCIRTTVFCYPINSKTYSLDINDYFCLVLLRGNVDIILIARYYAINGLHRKSQSENGEKAHLLVSYIGL